MIRKIIEINEEKCNGCGACAAACHEGAIGMVNGKAKLLRDDYCDGLGDCLPACPTGAITFVEREAAAYDEQAVLAKKHSAASQMRPSDVDNHDEHGVHTHEHSGGCPGSRMHRLQHTSDEDGQSVYSRPSVSRLGQWPCQIKLVPVNGPYFDGAKLLIAADCTAYAYAGMHEEFMRGKITLIGCPKLDSEDYSVKLKEIIQNNDIQSLTIVRMEVPCCGGLEAAAKKALQKSGKFIPWNVVTISIDGNILD